MDKCHSVKSLVIWGVISAYKATFLKWDGLLCKHTSISLIESSFHLNFYIKFCMVTKRCGEKERRRRRQVCEVPSSHTARNICRLKSWCSFSPSPVLHNFLFVNLSCKNSPAKGILLPVRTLLYHFFLMQTTAAWCLSVCLTSELAEGGEEQQGREES